MKEHIADYCYEEWKKLEKEFERDFATSTRYNKSFRSLINEILEGETSSEFCSKTGLSFNMLSRLKNQVDETDPPQRNTLVSVCIGYNLDFMMTQSLLHSLGLDFNRFSRRDYAYTFLLTRCRDNDVDECNEILQKLGIEEKYWLGYHARKKTT
jgi:hypothetical protein